MPVYFAVQWKRIRKILRDRLTLTRLFCSKSYPKLPRRMIEASSANSTGIESLNTIVLLWQKEPRARIHERQQDGSWLAREVSGMDSILPIASLEVEVPLAKLYDQVDFNAKE